MPRARQYTKDDVNRILMHSEGRASPVSGESGHALGKHVEVSGYQISDRLVGSFGGNSLDFPIIVEPTGAVATEADHRAIWKEKHIHEGMSHAEISQLTELPTGTVKSHIRRGSERLREMLAAYRPDPEGEAP
ncbi:MAG: sigma factor-like helix-turn-helix DNA-binding protein [Proteobacteria bacterium]|nr:sigma factor-like helix-turn-helix DNA-binding protein [Pseudomonadota bacterium]